MEQVFTLQYSYDEPYYLAVGSKSDKPLVVNTLNFPGVQKTFGDYLQKNPTPPQANPSFTNLSFNNSNNNSTSFTTKNETLHAGKKKSKAKGKGKKKNKGGRKK